MDRISLIISPVVEKSTVRFILSAVPAAISSCVNKLSFALSAKYSHIFCPFSSVKSVLTELRISSIFSPSNDRSFGNAFKAQEYLLPFSQIPLYSTIRCLTVGEYDNSNHPEILQSARQYR